MMQRIKSKTFWGKALAVFFVVMAVCTVISRAADSLIVPRVQTKKASAGNLNYKIEGAGYIKASEGKIVTVPESLRVKSAVQPGVNVQEGEELARIDTDELERELEKQNAALDKLKLQLEKEQLDAVPDAVTPQTFSAGKALDRAKENLGDAEAKLAEAAAAEQADAPERQMKAEKEKQDAYDAFVSQGGDSNPEAKAAYDQAVAGIEQSAGQENAQKQEELKALEAQRDAMQSALKDAEAAYEVAQKEDANRQSNQQKAKESAGLNQQGTVIDIEQQQKLVDRLQEIADAQGAIRSPVKGTVTENGLTEGAVTTGQECIRLGTGKFQFQAAADKEDASKLKPGDTLEVEFPDKKEKKKLKILSIWNGQPQEGEENKQETEGNTTNLTADMEGDDYTEGTEGKYAVQKKSDIRYNSILPIEAVREDQKGMYCLAARKVKTILGEEYKAERINLTKKEKDADQIAVEGALTEDTRIIISGTKEINEGDRVRIEDSN